MPQRREGGREGGIEEATVRTYWSILSETEFHLKYILNSSLCKLAENHLIEELEKQSENVFIIMNYKQDSVSGM